MKNVLALATFLILTAGSVLILTAGSAQASGIPVHMLPIHTVQTDLTEFATRYNLDSFKIASDSVRLRGMGQVVSGVVEINEFTNQLRLTLVRNINCPAGRMCITLAPAPTVITLPIRHIDTSACGGVTILAERNLQLVDAGLTRVEVIDTNGSRCSDNADDVTFVKRVTVTLTEEGARDRVEALSVFSGFPSNRF